MYQENYRQLVSKDDKLPLSQNKFNQYPQLGKSVSQPFMIYKQWKVYKDKPPICTLPFPYCLQSQVKIQNQQKRKVFNSQNSHRFRNLYRLKISNRLQQYDEPKPKTKIYTPYINYQKTPLNQYLNYQLSQEINIGIKQVQMMANQIKKLKKKKRNGVDLQKPVKQKGIRVRKSYIKNWKGVYVNDNQSIRV